MLVASSVAMPSCLSAMLVSNNSVFLESSTSSHVSGHCYTSVLEDMQPGQCGQRCAETCAVNVQMGQSVTAASVDKTDDSSHPAGPRSQCEGPVPPGKGPGQHA